jgi:hypothetical protein
MRKYQFERQRVYGVGGTLHSLRVNARRVKT